MRHITFKTQNISVLQQKKSVALQGNQGNLKKVYEQEEAEAMNLAREYMLDTGMTLKSRSTQGQINTTARSSQAETQTSQETFARAKPVPREIQILREEQKRLIPSLPEELEENMPEELKQFVMGEVSAAYKTMAEDDATSKQDQEIRLSEEGQHDKTLTENVSEHKSELPQTGKNDDELEKLLHLADEMPEEMAKDIYLSIKSTMKTLKQREEEKKMKELIKLQMEQMKLFPNLPEDLVKNLPPEVVDAMNIEIKAKLPRLAGTTTPDIDDKLIELQMEQQELMPDLPEELLQNLDPALQAQLRKEAKRGYQWMAKTSIPAQKKQKTSLREKLFGSFSGKTEPKTAVDTTIKDSSTSAQNYGETGAKSRNIDEKISNLERKENDLNESLPEIDAVAELPDTELKSKAAMEIEELDKEKDPAEAESRIKQIMSMLLMRLQRLQEREAKVDTISDPKEREAARAEIEAVCWEYPDTYLWG